MTNTINIPLNKLVAWEGNVRKTDSDAGLSELAASIAAHGLLQSLVVRKDKKGKYAVVAGQRRLNALRCLVEGGTFDKDFSVPCQLISNDADGLEISLAENAMREDMHPADEFEAFRALVDAGMPVIDIAARFGVTENIVQQRLKLARVNPVLIDAYRKADITLAHVMAFAVVDDHEAQEHVFNSLPDHRFRPDYIRDALTDGEIKAGDKRVKFVTLKAYEKAGGTVRRDLFSQGDDGVFIQDIALLENLVTKKLDKAADKVRKEGWKWVETRYSYDYAEWSDCSREHKKSAPLSPEQQAEIEALKIEYNTFLEAQSYGEDEEEHSRIAEIETAMEELQGEASWQAESLAMAGAIISIDYSGEIEINRGYVLPEDQHKKSPKTVTRTNEDGTVETIEVKKDFGLSAALVESLTGERTAALMAELMLNPRVALVSLTHSMAVQSVLNGRHPTCMQISASTAPSKTVREAGAFEAIAHMRNNWAERIPGNPDDLWLWCLEQDQAVLIELLAFCAATTINAVQTKAVPSADAQLRHADALGKALGLDMAQWFKPTAANYFSRISKDNILTALQEANGSLAPAWNKAKKGELAAIAETRLADTGWLPQPLRGPATPAL